MAKVAVVVVVAAAKVLALELVQALRVVDQVAEQDVAPVVAVRVVPVAAADQVDRAVAVDQVAEAGQVAVVAALVVAEADQLLHAKHPNPRPLKGRSILGCMNKNR